MNGNRQIALCEKWDSTRAKAFLIERVSAEVKLEQLKERAKTGEGRLLPGFRCTPTNVHVRIAACLVTNRPKKTPSCRQSLEETSGHWFDEILRANP